MGTEIKFGCTSDDVQGFTLPVAAEQYFHRMGGHFVYTDATGAVTLAATPIGTLLGWAEVPKDAAGYNAWKSSATAKADSVFVITDPSAVYAIPVTESTASLTASLVGDCADLVLAGSTYTIKQTLNLGVSTRDYLRIEAIDKVNKIAYVRINYAKYQADT